MCTQSLSCLKSKYLLFFSARRVSRYAGRDVSTVCLGDATANIFDMLVLNRAITKSKYVLK